MADSHAAPKWNVKVEDKFIQIFETEDNEKPDESSNVLHIIIRNIEGIEKCREIYMGNPHCALRIHGSFHNTHGSIIYDDCERRDKDYEVILRKIKNL